MNATRRTLSLLVALALFGPTPSARADDLTAGQIRISGLQPTDAWMEGVYVRSGDWPDYVYTNERFDGSDGKAKVWLSKAGEDWQMFYQAAGGSVSAPYCRVLTRPAGVFDLAWALRSQFVCWDYFLRLPNRLVPGQVSSTVSQAVAGGSQILVSGMTQEQNLRLNGPYKLQQFGSSVIYKGERGRLYRPEGTTLWQLDLTNPYCQITTEPVVTDLSRAVRSQFTCWYYCDEEKKSNKECKEGRRILPGRRVDSSVSEPPFLVPAFRTLTPLSAVTQNDTKVVGLAEGKLVLAEPTQGARFSFVPQKEFQYYLVPEGMECGYQRLCAVAATSELVGGEASLRQVRLEPYQPDNSAMLVSLEPSPEGKGLYIVFGQVLYDGKPLVLDVKYQGKAVGTELIAAPRIDSSQTAHQRFELDQGAITLRSALAFIEYHTGDEVPDGEKVFAIEGQKLSNCSSKATLTDNVTRSITRGSSYTWGFEESLGVSMEATFEVGVPFVGSTEVTIGAEASVARNQQWETSEEVTWEFSRDLELEPMSAVELSAYINWVPDYSTRFTAEFLVWGSSENLDGSKTQLRPYEVLQLLRSKGFDGSVLSETGNMLRVGIDGTFSGTFGLNSVVTVRDLVPACG